MKIRATGNDGAQWLDETEVPGIEVVDEHSCVVWRILPTPSGLAISCVHDHPSLLTRQTSDNRVELIREHAMSQRAMSQHGPGTAGVKPDGTLLLEAINAVVALPSMANGRGPDRAPTTEERKQAMQAWSQLHHAIEVEERRQAPMPRENGLLVSDARRVIECKELILNYGSMDGAHHKQWLLDQILRKLTNPEEYTALMEPLMQDWWSEGIAP